MVVRLVRARLEVVPALLLPVEVVPLPAVSAPVVSSSAAHLVPAAVRPSRREEAARLVAHRAAERLAEACLDETEEEAAREVDRTCLQRSGLLLLLGEVMQCTKRAGSAGSARAARENVDSARIDKGLTQTEGEHEKDAAVSENDSGRLRHKRAKRIQSCSDATTVPSLVSWSLAASIAGMGASRWFRCIPMISTAAQSTTARPVSRSSHFEL